MWLSNDAKTFIDEKNLPVASYIISPEERVVQAWFSFTLAKDKALTMRLFSEQSVIEIPFHESGKTEVGCFRRYVGLSEIAVFTEGSHSGEGDMVAWDIEVHRVTPGPTVIVESRGGVVTTFGKDYQNRYVFRFDVVLGKIMLLREYYNPVTSAIMFGRPLASNDLAWNKQIGG